MNDLDKAMARRIGAALRQAYAPLLRRIDVLEKQVADMQRDAELYRRCRASGMDEDEARDFVADHAADKAGGIEIPSAPAKISSRV